MSRTSVTSRTAPELVQRFIDIGIAQDIALLANEIGKVTRLSYEIRDLTEELKSRSGDERHLLLSLYDHPNNQVRLNAAKATLAIAPTAARVALERLAEDKLYSQALDAGMCLWTLDQGIFKPT